MSDHRTRPGGSADPTGGGRPPRAIVERGTVVSVGDGSVTVRCSTTEACSSCSSLLCSPRERTYEAVANDEADGPGRLAEGDVVDVEVPDSHALGKAVLLFALPLVLFAGIYALLGFTESETQRVAGGFAGLAAGFGLAVLVSRWMPEARPRVVSVYRDPELVPVGVSGPDTTS